MEEVRCREWPGMYRAGMAVVHEGRTAHVVAVPKRVMPEGYVPIMYDDEEGCFVKVPADDLTRRFK